MIERYRLYSIIFFGAVWVMLCQRFVLEELIPPLDVISTYISLLADAIFVILGIVTIRSRRDIAVLGALILISLISKYLNHQGIIAWGNGLRDFVGLVFIVPFIRYMMRREDYARRFTESMDRQLLIFLYVQAFCVTWQFALYGANDSGGGSLGFGGSGIISTLIYVVSFYLISKKWDRNQSYIRNVIENKIYIILLYPTFLNETKISFIYLLAYFVFLLKVDRRFIIRLLVTIPIMSVVVVALGYVYMSVTKQDSEEILTVEFFTEYLVGNDFDELVEVAIAVQDEDIETDNLWAVDLPRLGRFFILPEIMKSADGGMMWGAGLGQFKGDNVIVLSAFSRQNRWFLQGSVTMLFSMLVQIGIIGLLWYLVNVITIIFTSNKFLNANNLRLYLLLVFMMLLVYNDSFRYAYFCAIFFYISMEGLQIAGKEDKTPNSARV